MASSTLAIIIVIIAIAMFISGKFSAGVIGTVGALMVGVLLPEVELSTVYSGFGSNTITLCAGMCVVSEALFHTGVGQKIGEKINSTPVVNSERVFCAVVAAICTLQSAFMSNNGTVAMWMALIVTISAVKGSKIRAKMAIFPAATGAIIGGGCTLVGSTSQAVANGLLQTEPGYEAGMAVFDMTRYAWPMAVVAIIFWLTIGYDLEVKVLKPDSPDFNKGNVYAAPEAGNLDEIPAWKGMVSLGVLIGSIVCFILSGFQPFKTYMNIGTIPLMAAVILFVLKVVPVHETLSKLPWDTIISIGTLPALGTGLSKTGAGAMIANFVLGLFGDNTSPIVMLIVFTVLGGFLTCFMANAGTVSMLVPIAIPLAASLGVSPMPFVVALAVSTNMAIATPMGTAVNYQILPVGYTFKDFLCIGGPLWILLMITMSITMAVIGF